MCYWFENCIKSSDNYFPAVGTWHQSEGEKNINELTLTNLVIKNWIFPVIIISFISRKLMQFLRKILIHVCELKCFISLLYSLFLEWIFVLKISLNHVLQSVAAAVGWGQQSCQFSVISRSKLVKDHSLSYLKWCLQNYLVVSYKIVFKYSFTMNFNNLEDFLSCHCFSSSRLASSNTCRTTGNPASLYCVDH